MVLGRRHGDAMWNNVAVSLIEGPRGGSEGIEPDGRGGRRASTLDNARFFARLNLAIADGIIGCWDAKYAYVFWRLLTVAPRIDAPCSSFTVPIKLPVKPCAMPTSASRTIAAMARKMLRRTDGTERRRLWTSM